MSCENAKTGVIALSDSNNKIIEIKIPIAPFYVSCAPSGNCGRQGTRNLSNVTSRNVPQCNRDFVISSFENENLYFQSRPNSSGYEGLIWDLRGQCPGNDRLIYDSFSVLCGKPFITSNQFIGSTDGLTVKDVNGNIIIQLATTTCKYQISCDDNCPDGYIKGHSDKYPGYCCTPCQDIESKINSLLQKARSLHG
jgi:hypothetical protein